MKRRLALALSVLVTTSVFAQTDSQTEKPKTSHSGGSAPVSKQLEDMKDAISAQQQQIQQLQQQISHPRSAIQQLQQQVNQANRQHSRRPPTPQPPPRILVWRPGKRAAA